MTTVTRVTDLRTEVIRADPQWPVTSRIITEYEFPSPKGREPRAFKADYTKRGAYADSE